MSKSIFNTGKGGELLPATADVLGGIKVGTNLSITGDGILSATVQSGSGGTVTSVTTTQDDVNTLGISHTVSSTAPVITLKRPFNSLSDEFVLDDSAPLPADKRVLRSRKATTSASGTVVVPLSSGLTVNGSGSLNVNVDGTTITKDATTGVLSGASTYTLPTATASVLGGIKVGSGLAIAAGVLSATAQTPSDATTSTKGIVQVTEGNGLAISSGILSKGTLQSYASGSGGISISGNTISASQASASTNGYLTSTDWSTFNNKQPAISNATSTEIGYLSGVTSAIQTQLNSKQATISNATSTEIGYLSGVTSAIQTQLDSKQSGGLTVPTTPATLTSSSDISQFTLSKRPTADSSSTVVPRIFTPASSGGVPTNGHILSIQADTINIAASKVAGTNDGNTTSGGSQCNGFNIGPSGIVMRGAVTFDAGQSISLGAGSTVTASDFVGDLRGFVRTNDIRADTGSTLNIGSSSLTTSTINIGNTSSTTNILGNTTYISVNQLQVKDQLITLNKGGNTVTGAGSGIEINELFSVRQSANMLSINTNQLELQFPSGVTDNTQFMFFSTSAFSGVTGISTNTVYSWKLVSSKYIVHTINGEVPVTVGGTIPLSLTAVILLIKNGGGVESSTGYVKTSSDRDSWLFKAPGKAGVLTMAMPDTDTTLNVGVGQPTQVVFTSGSGTFTIPSLVTMIDIQMVAGGAGGGAASSTTVRSAGGGGAGGYVRAKIPVTQGAVLSYTVGAGGAENSNTTNGTLAGNNGSNSTFSITTGATTYSGSCTGGKGALEIGTDQAGGHGGLGGLGGAAGTVTNATNVLGIQGGDGDSAGDIAAGLNNPTAGSGGASFFGGGGKGSPGNNTTNALLVASPGVAYGSGGGGGTNNGNTGHKIGRAGAGGVIIIQYFSLATLPNTYTPVAPLSFSGSNLIYTISSATAITYAASPATNGPAFEFTSIPSNVKRITIMVKDLKHTSSGGSDFGIQLGTSSAYFTTASYRTNVSLINGGFGQGGAANATSFLLMTTVNNSTVLHGTITLTLLDSNTWCYTGTTSYIDNGAQSFSSGNVVLNGQLTRLKIINTAAANCYGTVNILYE